MTVTESPYAQYYAKYAPRTHGRPAPVPLNQFPRGREFYKSIGEPKKIVAPMVDQSELAWRVLARRYGAELCYTPMIHARVYSNPKTSETFRIKAFSTMPEDRPLIAQFCANDPKELLAAAQMIEDKCDAVDLNLGCPQGIAKKGFYGSFLQDEWDLIYDMLSTLHINLHIPVCAKIRVFEDKQKTLAYAKHVCSTGISILTVHGRTRDMKGQWTGLADWDIIRAIREVIPREVVMFANGNIQYLGDLERCLAVTGVDGIMSAEGHLHNPAIFLDPNEPMERRNPRIDHLAREYLEIVRELKDPLSDVAVKAHLFAIFRVAINIHTDIRNFLGTARGWEGWEKTVEMFEERIEKELKENPEVEGSDIVPWYRCQPYLRPDPGPRPPKKQKRKHEETEANTDVEVLV